jgi:hypothetical protein
VGHASTSILNLFFVTIKNLLIQDDQILSYIIKICHKKAFVMIFDNVIYYASQINSCDNFINMSYIDAIQDVSTPS